MLAYLRRFGAGIAHCANACLSASQGRWWAGEQRTGARRITSSRYQRLSAEERVQIGTPAAVSTWRSEIRPVSSLQTFGRGVAGWSARRSRGGARVYRCVSVGSQDADRSKETRRTVSESVLIRLQTLRLGRFPAVTPDGPLQVGDSPLIPHDTCVSRMPGAATPGVRQDCCWPAWPSSACRGRRRESKRSCTGATDSRPGLRPASTMSVCTRTPVGT